MYFLPINHIKTWIIEHYFVLEAILLITKFTLRRIAELINPFSDLVLSLTVGVDETIPYELFQRSSFWNSRRLLLIMWIVMANVLSYAYKGTLLSTLVILRYLVKIG